MWVYFVCVFSFECVIMPQFFDFHVPAAVVAVIGFVFPMLVLCRLRMISSRAKTMLSETRQTWNDCYQQILEQPDSQHNMDCINALCKEFRSRKDREIVADLERNLGIKGWLHIRKQFTCRLHFWPHGNQVAPLGLVAVDRPGIDCMYVQAMTLAPFLTVCHKSGHLKVTALFVSCTTKWPPQQISLRMRSGV